MFLHKPNKSIKQNITMRNTPPLQQYYNFTFNNLFNQQTNRRYNFIISTKMNQFPTDLQSKESRNMLIMIKTFENHPTRLKIWHQD